MIDEYTNKKSKSFFTNKKNSQRSHLKRVSYKKNKADTVF